MIEAIKEGFAESDIIKFIHKFNSPFFFIWYLVVLYTHCIIRSKFVDVTFADK